MTCSFTTQSTACTFDRLSYRFYGAFNFMQVTTKSLDLEWNQAISAPVAKHADMRWLQLPRCCWLARTDAC
jgi:hypothetical protein